jgi:tRNA threonylcarbamoyladenosine biosynthesis protein TsaE
MNSITYELQGIREAAAWLVEHLRNEKIWCFSGEMGAGKTTLIAALCEQMGISDAVSSPTYGLVNEYRVGSSKVYHFDFYRIENEGEAIEMGVEEYFYSGNICFIEWPQKVTSLLPNKFVQIDLRIFEDNSRQLSFKHVS